MKSQRWVPPKKLGLMKSQRWVPLWVDADSKKCQICVVQMAKNLVHSFYYILYQPKGVPSPSCNFSGTGGINIYRDSPLSTVPGIVRFTNSTKHTDSPVQYGFLENFKKIFTKFGRKNPKLIWTFSKISIKILIQIHLVINSKESPNVDSASEFD